MDSTLLPFAGFAILLGLVLWPAFEAFQRGRWGWLALIVVIAPVGGALWSMTGRRNVQPI